MINTIAGGGPNDLPAVAASLFNPSSIAIDADGNLFVAASGQGRAFKIDASGQLTVVAGNDGYSGFSGDGGSAANASLACPFGVALDASGNLFIADRCGHRVRRVDATSQIITTVAGNGVPGFSGDGSLATNGTLSSPYAVALDAEGNLFIADQGNNRIRRVDAVNQIITTVAGNGTRGFSGDGGPATNASLAVPSGVALDAEGNFFIADQQNDRIRRVDAITQTITTVAGIGCPSVRCFGGDGGPATSARLRNPTGVTVDAAGNLFIADRSNHRIRRVDSISQIITTVAGPVVSTSGGDGGLATNLSLLYPHAVALDAEGNLFIADQFNHRIRRVDAFTQVITTVAGNGTERFGGDGDLATKASFWFPQGAARDAAGNLFIADRGNSRIRRVDGATQIITTVAGNGTQSFSGDGGLATSAGIAYPSSVALDAAGNLFIAAYPYHRVRRVDAITQIITTVAGNGSAGFSGDSGLATSAGLDPGGIALDPAGNLFIADSSNQRIRRVDAMTQIITTIAGDGCVEDAGPNRPPLGCFGGDGGLATSGSLAYPEGVALDAAGNLFIADTRNHRIRRVDAITQIITTVAGSGTAGFGGDGGSATSARLWYPYSVALDTAGNLFVSDTENFRIRRVDAITQIITTVAGNGTSSFSGDGGPATNASLAGPFGVALDSAGNVLIADSHNSRIRQVGDATIAMRIDIDIKPGSNPNSINPSDRGVIPVAILGSESFDVTEIEESSLRFAAGEAASAHDLVDPAVFADHVEDVNNDGIADLVSHYRAEESGILYGDMAACLSGETLDGSPFKGCDAVRTVPDMDGDRLLDVDEDAAGTNALFRDSDGDGYDDGIEVLTLGTDPLDALDPAPTPVEQKKPSRLRNRRH